MRKTLEDLYYGNITPGEQQMVHGSELQKAVDRVVRFESQLTERLDEDGQTILSRVIDTLCNILGDHRKLEFKIGDNVFMDFDDKGYMLTLEIVPQGK